MDAAKKFLRAKKNPNFPDVIELENQEYAIYAHVVSNTDLEDFVNARFNGRVTICVSPISNIGKKLFSEKGIILGYTKVPRGSFIGSSNNSMHSNSYIQNNDYEPKEDNYYHLEIKDSSALTPGSYPETLLYREGLVPTCIIIRGQEPSLEEREAQKKFAKLGLDLPFVHTQAIGDIATLSGKEAQMIASEKTEQSVISEEKIDIGEYNPELAKLKEIRKKIIKIKEKIAALNIKQDEVYDIIKLSIGGSHDMYKCHVKGKKGVFYLKPGVRKDGEAPHQIL